MVKSGSQLSVLSKVKTPIEDEEERFLRVLIPSAIPAVKDRANAF